MTTNHKVSGRDNRGRYSRTADGAERDAEACRLRGRGCSYQQISDQLGYGGKANAHRAIRQALAAIPAEGAEELRRLELDRLDEMHRRALAVMERDHIVISNGRLVLDDDGRPILDDGPVLQAIDRLLRIQERRAKLLGLDAPTRSRVEVVDDDVARMLIEQLEAELAELIGDDEASEGQSQS